MPSQFSHTRPLGKLIRLPLSLVPDGMPIPILSGPNRGMRWVTGTGTNRACWLGWYEADHFSLLPWYVRSGMTVYDIGANAGFYTLALSRMVGPQGRVFAFEPDIKHVTALTRHISLNRVENVTVVQAAVSQRTGFAGFADNRLEAGGYLVSTVSLDEFANGNAPQFIKMDIEGAEVEALRGASKLLETKPVLCLATHSLESHYECRRLLASVGYRFQYFDETPWDFIAFPS